MTKLLHIVGAQGSGKTQLALAIIAALEKRGKTARNIADEGYLRLAEVRQVAQERKCWRAPYSRDTTQPELIILEHQVRPAWLLASLQPGDQVITIEVSA